MSERVEDRSEDVSSSLADLNRETADLPPSARKLGGRYSIVKRLGSGGMGSVFEVEDPDGKRLAAKVISKKTLEPTALKRFFREAQTARAIENEHVVKTLELGLDDGSGAPFIVMELLTGQDLRGVIADQSPLASEIVARIGAQAADGLAAAHAAGIVHRDVKPSNIFLARTDGRVSVKVCDFGIAKQVDDSNDESSHELTHSGGLLGSPRYMSPEQAKSARRVDARSDVWSLCAALYEAASGKELWGDHTSLGEVIVAICTEPIAPLDEIAPWVDKGLARTLQRGLERDLDARWQNMEVLGAALSRSTRGTNELFEDDLQRVADATLLEKSPYSRRTTIFVGAGVLALLAIAAVVATRPKPELAANPAPPPAETESVPGLLVPAGASVSVNGNARDVVDGRVALKGQPGDWFDVRVTRGAQSVDRRVYVTRTGTLDPPNVELAAPSVPAPTVTPIKRAPVVTRPAPSPSTSAPSSAALPPVPSQKPGVEPKEEW
jgi:eukaryotic-like serine/threonine-protein kinase